MYNAENTLGTPISRQREGVKEKQCRVIEWRLFVLCDVDETVKLTLVN